MYTLYILYSKKINRYYVGSTGNLESRLQRHNFKSRGYTGQTSDWELVYTEEYKLKSNCLARERQIKKWKSRLRIRELIIRNQTE